MSTSTTGGHRLFAAVYDRMVAPVERGVLGPRRAGLLGPLTGTVLDVGAGTGVNLAHLRAAERVVAAEPDPAMRRRLRERARDAPVPVQVCDAGAEDLPLPDGSVDAVACTLVLCTVADPERALAEIRRVLRPDGRLVLIEHVRGDGRQARWQQRLDPVWTRVMAGCHLTRDTGAAVRAAGFRVEREERFTVGPPVNPAAPALQLTAVPGGEAPGRAR